MTNKCIHYQFEDQAKNNPDNIALLYVEKELTYAELNEKANQLAGYLKANKITLEQPIGICIERSFELFIAILAVLKAGGAYVPLEPRHPSDRILWIVDDAKVQIILTQSHLMENFKNFSGKIVRLDADWDDIEIYSKKNLEQSVNNKNLIYIMYTSGSTGKPKGVCIEHGNVANFVEAQKDIFDINDKDRVLQFSSINFDASVLEWSIALTQGATLCLVPATTRKTVIDAFLETLLIYKLTFACLTPAVVNSIPRELLSTLHTLAVVGDVCTKKIISDWYGHVKLINGYGPTETTIFAATFNCDFKHPASTIGYPLKNFNIYILDEFMQPVSVGDIGEIYIGGMGLARCYLNQPELTKSKFINSPLDASVRLYKSGDLARYLSDGAIEYVGRNDQQVKIRGNRIELNEIAAVLLNVEGINNALVVIEDDSKSKIVAFVILEEGIELSQDQIINKVSEFLPEYMLPNLILFLKDFPINLNGKYDKESLSFIAKQGYIKSSVQHKSSINSIVENKLLEILSELLDCNLGVNDDFFSLGMDSIIVLQMIMRSQQQGITIAAKDIFSQRNVKKLAKTACLSKHLQLKKLNVDTDVPFSLTPIQCWFFEHGFSNQNYWNQSVLIEINDDKLNVNNLKKALNDLISMHDSLRLSFYKINQKWKQSYKDFNQQPEFFKFLNIDDFDEINKQVFTCQQELDIYIGQLIKSILFHYVRDKKYYLSIIIHHLAIDGISWRVILEELPKLYYSYENNTKVSLQYGRSYFNWVNELCQYSQKKSVEDELDYWKNTIAKIDDIQTTPFPKSEGTHEFCEVMQFQLNKNETNFLLYEINSVYDTQINDILLSALCLMFSKITHEKKLALMLDRHGREHIVADSFNFAHTVGWFTSLFPICFNIEETVLPQIILSIKKELSSVPANGVGYGVLKYLVNDEEKVAVLKKFREPSILFNYLGQWVSSLDENKVWRFMGLDNVGCIDKKNKLHYNLEIKTMILDGQMIVYWIYSSEHYSAKTIKEWGEGYLGCLSQVITHCLNESVRSLPKTGKTS